MVKIRLKRLGRRHRPYYRVAVMETRNPRDGKTIEEVGFYDPINKDPGKQFSLKEDRVKFWLGQGAQASDTVRDLMRKQGISLVQSKVEQQSENAEI